MTFKVKNVHVGWLVMRQNFYFESEFIYILILIFLYYIFCFQFVSQRSERKEQVFAVKVASFMQTPADHSNLLETTTITRRFVV